MVWTIWTRAPFTDVSGVKRQVCPQVTHRSRSTCIFRGVPPTFRRAYAAGFCHQKPRAASSSIKAINNQATVGVTFTDSNILPPLVPGVDIQETSELGGRPSFAVDASSGHPDDERLVHSDQFPDSSVGRRQGTEYVQVAVPVHCFPVVEWWDRGDLRWRLGVNLTRTSGHN